MIPGRVGLGGEDNSTKLCDSGRGQWTTSTNRVRESNRTSIGEFDPGSGRTLAACLTHASQGGPQGQPANGCVTREQPAECVGDSRPNGRVIPHTFPWGSPWGRKAVA